MYEMGQAIGTTVASFPGSSPPFCRILYSIYATKSWGGAWERIYTTVRPGGCNQSPLKYPRGQSKVRHKASF